MDSTDSWQQLMLLRGLTASTGILHEAQVVQLRMWPYVAIPSLATHKFSPDTQSKLLKYTLYTDGPVTDEEKGRLTKNIRALLGDDWEVEYVVRKNRKKKSNG